MAILKDLAHNTLRSTSGAVLLDTGPAPGSTDDFAARLRCLLPTGWFPAAPQDGEDEQAPVLAGMLQGLGSVLSAAWSQIQQAGTQTRIATASGPFLDMVAEDYFGAGAFERLSNESDLRYRNRIMQSLLAPLNTRAAVAAAITRVTGQAPTIIEPMNAADCHAYGSADAPVIGGGYGYGTSGFRYGSNQGGQFFIETTAGDASSPSVIYQTVSKTAALGVVGWVRIEE